MRQIIIRLLFPIMTACLFGQESGYSSIEHIYISGRYGLGSGRYGLGFDVEEIALAAAYKFLPSNINVNKSKLPKLDKGDPDYLYKLTHRAHLDIKMMSTDWDLLDNCSATFINVEIGVPAEFIHLEDESSGTRFMPIFSMGTLVTDKSTTETADIVKKFIEEGFIELAAKIEAYP